MINGMVTRSVTHADRLRRNATNPNIDTMSFAHGDVLAETDLTKEAHQVLADLGVVIR